MARRPPCWSLSTKRIRLVVGYDGGEFCGWAAQHGLRTVQSTLTNAVRQVSGEEIEIVGASRTDSGAHAKGQVCHFDCKVAIPPERWAYALNKVLPPDLGVINSRAVKPSFHSRFSASDRWYRYRILCETIDPLRSRYTFGYWKQLDLEAMQRAASYLVGNHDFRAFSEELEPETNAVRDLFSVEVKPKADEIWIDIVGTAFIRGMMRRISGGLLEIGRGYRDEAEFATLLDPEKRESVQWPVVLPARGLTLMRVRYGRHPKDNRTACDSE